LCCADFTDQFGWHLDIVLVCATSRWKVKTLRVTRVHGLASTPGVVGLAVCEARFLRASTFQNPFVQASLSVCYSTGDHLVTNTDFKMAFVMSCDFHLYWYYAACCPCLHGTSVEVHIVAVTGPLTSIPTNPVAVSAVRATLGLGATQISSRRIAEIAMSSCKAWKEQQQGGYSCHC